MYVSVRSNCNSSSEYEKQKDEEIEHSLTVLQEWAVTERNCQFESLSQGGQEKIEGENRKNVSSNLLIQTKSYL